MDFIVGAEIYDHLEKVADRFGRRCQWNQRIVIEPGKGRAAQVDATLGLPILVGLIAVALLFDFLKRVARCRQLDCDDCLDPGAAAAIRRAVAAFFNFVAFLVFGLNVANTIGTGIIDPASSTRR